MKRSVRKKSAFNRPILLLGIGVSAVIGSLLLYAFSYVMYAGRDLERFCEEISDGMSSEDAIAAARDAGFEARETRDSVLVTLAGKRVGHSCFMTVGGGKVTETHTAFTY